MYSNTEADNGSSSSLVTKVMEQSTPASFPTRKSRSSGGAESENDNAIALLSAPSSSLSLAISSEALSPSLERDKENNNEHANDFGGGNSTLENDHPATANQGEGTQTCCNPNRAIAENSPPKECNVFSTPASQRLSIDISDYNSGSDVDDRGDGDDNDDHANCTLRPPPPLSASTSSSLCNSASSLSCPFPDVCLLRQQQQQIPINSSKVGNENDVGEPHHRQRLRWHNDGQSSPTDFHHRHLPHDDDELDPPRKLALEAARGAFTGAFLTALIVIPFFILSSTSSTSMLSSSFMSWATTRTSSRYQQYSPRGERLSSSMRGFTQRWRGKGNDFLSSWMHSSSYDNYDTNVVASEQKQSKQRQHKQDESSEAIDEGDNEEAYSFSSQRQKTPADLHTKHTSGAGGDVLMDFDGMNSGVSIATKRQKATKKKTPARRSEENEPIKDALGNNDNTNARTETIKTETEEDARKLASSSNLHPELVVAGKLVVDEGPCNIGQLDLETGQWSLQERIQLSLYNSYSGGEVYSLLANRAFVNSNVETSSSRSSSRNNNKRGKDLSQYGGELIVVGAFDTTYRNSQVTYCSVGKWDGTLLSKVGEGLCNSAVSKGMKITTAALAGPTDVFVAGSFHTQVWNGDRHQFVKIFNIAHYNAVEQVWLPLPVGQISCSWCLVTVLAIAWDSKRNQLHVAGKFNAIDERNIPAGLAIYDQNTGHLVAHPGGGLTMKNITQDGVGTALQLDEDNGVLYVMGSFERLSQTNSLCAGLAAYEIETNRWTCLADPAHTVLPTGGGNMLLTTHGLMVAGKTTSTTTWQHGERPYTIALLNTAPKKQPEKAKNTKVHIVSGENKAGDNKPSPSYVISNVTARWSWLPGFNGHEEPLHTLSNGFGNYEGFVFIGGDNLVAKWGYVTKTFNDEDNSNRRTTSTTIQVPVTVDLSNGHVRGSIMAISQLSPQEKDDALARPQPFPYTIVIYCVSLGALIGMVFALACNKSLSQTILSFIFERDAHLKGISLDTLTYSAVENPNVTEAYKRAMTTRFVTHPHLLTLIDPQEIILHRIIGEGTFGRVWSSKWRNSSVAVKEFVFAQAAVAGRSTQQNAIIEEIIGEAGMMAMLRHPHVLQLFGCSLTAQAIWIVSELCSLGSLRQLLDDDERELPTELKLQIALQVAEGMTYLHAQKPEIIHRDLKSHNIFVHETFDGNDTAASPRNSERLLNGPATSRPPRPSRSSREDGEKPSPRSTIVAKIGDWGSARATLSGSRTMTHGVGTACWLAPEVIKHARSSKKSDVYGYGIVLWELATRREVYEGLEGTQIIAMVANDNLRPDVPQDCIWKELMVQCWSENPQDRPDFEEISKRLMETKENLTPSLAAAESQRSIWSNQQNNQSSYHDN